MRTILVLLVVLGASSALAQKSSWDRTKSSLLAHEHSHRAYTSIQAAAEFEKSLIAGLGENMTLSPEQLEKVRSFYCQNREQALVNLIYARQLDTRRHARVLESAIETLQGMDCEPTQEVATLENNHKKNRQFEDVAAYIRNYVYHP